MGPTKRAVMKVGDSIQEGAHHVQDQVVQHATTLIVSHAWTIRRLVALLTV